MIIRKEQKLQNSVSLSLLPAVKLVSLEFQNMEPNSWVLVVCEGEKFLVKVVTKIKGYMQCLSKPYEIRAKHVFENDAIFCKEAFEASIKLLGNRTGDKTIPLFSYYYIH